MFLVRRLSDDIQISSCSHRTMEKVILQKLAEPTDIAAIVFLAQKFSLKTAVVSPLVRGMCT